MRDHLLELTFTKQQVKGKQTKLYSTIYNTDRDIIEMVTKTKHHQE